MGQEHGGKFQKHTSYILQDDNLYPWFTVHEAMTVAANLKISKECMSQDEKQNLVNYQIKSLKMHLPTEIHYLIITIID